MVSHFPIDIKLINLRSNDQRFVLRVPIAELRRGYIGNYRANTHLGVTNIMQVTDSNN
jgi:hypothetical protein